MILRVVVGVLSVRVEYQLPHPDASVLGAEFEECFRDRLGGVRFARSGHAKKRGALGDGSRSPGSRSARPRSRAVPDRSDSRSVIRLEGLGAMSGDAFG